MGESMQSDEKGAFGLRTRAVHAGIAPDPVTGAVGPNIATSTNFAATFGEIGFSALGTVEEAVPYAYAREGHPNAEQLETKLAALDGAEAALVFSTGIAAITGLLLHKLAPGDHAVISDVSYAGTAEFTRGFLSKKGIEVTVADLSDPSDLLRALRPSTKLVYAETPCNPILKLVDLEAIAGHAHAAGAELIVDSTFATPVVTRPIEFGADYVVHSLTKYYGGHGDALGGAVLGRTPAIASLREEVGIHLGATLSPFNCWLILRGIETLPIRMAAYSQSALQIAEYLEGHPEVESVTYPGLPSHPHSELAARQMELPSGMIAFRPKDVDGFGHSLRDNLHVFEFAASLGLSRSLILYCDTDDLQRTTFKLDDEHLARYREWAGDGFFRLSIGLEDPEDLYQDLDRALSATRVARAQADVTA
jgi:canavanine-gamma-lyase